MPHSTAPFYKEDDVEGRRIMAGDLADSLALGLQVGIGGTMAGGGGGVGTRGGGGRGGEEGGGEFGMEVEMGMGMATMAGMRAASMDHGIGMDMVDMAINMGMELDIGDLAVMKEEEDTGSPSRVVDTRREISLSASASETTTTLALINPGSSANETQFIFEFPGQDDENNTGSSTLANLNSNSHGGNNNISSTHNTTFEHEIDVSPSSENNNHSATTTNFISVPPLHSLDSYSSGSGTYNTVSLAGVPASSSTSALLPTSAILDEQQHHHHPLAAAAIISSSSSSSPLRPGSPTTESMRSMMSVFRVDPFASYDADAGSRRKRRKRGSSYAMLSDPEKTSREEPLMFTFQIEALPGSEYYENYETYHHHHLLGGAGDMIAGPSSSAMPLDHAFSTPSPHSSSPSISILPPGPADYYHQPSTSSSAGAEYSTNHPYLDSDDFSNMILGSTTTGGISTSTPACGDSGRSATTGAFSHLYAGYSSSRQSHPHHHQQQQSYHTLGANPSTSHHHHPSAFVQASSHQFHHQHQHQHQHQQHQQQHHHHQQPSHPDLTLNPTQDTAYMLQSMRQSMGMHMGNLGINATAVIGMNTMNTMSMPPPPSMTVAASLLRPGPSYQQPTAVTSSTPEAPPGGVVPSSSSASMVSSSMNMNMCMPVQSQQRALLQSQVIGVNVDDHHDGMGIPQPPPMDSLSVSHLGDIIDHLGSGSRGEAGGGEQDSGWTTPTPSHSSFSHHHQQHPSRNPPSSSYHHHSRYTSASQNNNNNNKYQGFGDALQEDEGENEEAESSQFDNHICKMRNINTKNDEKRSEESFSENTVGQTPRTRTRTRTPRPTPRPHSQLIQNHSEDRIEQSQILTQSANADVDEDDDDGRSDFQFGALSVSPQHQTEIDAGAGGQTTVEEIVEGSVDVQGDRNSKIRMGKLTPCRASSPLMVVVLADDGNNNDGDDDSGSKKPGTESKKLQELSKRNSPKSRFEDIVDSAEECKNELDSSFSYFKNDNDNSADDDAYSDVRKELFLLPTSLLPESQSEPQCHGRTHSGSSSEVVAVTTNETSCTSLKHSPSPPSSSPNPNTVAERVSSSYSYSSSYSSTSDNNVTLRPAFRLNAAQFDLDLDFDPDFDFHHHSHSHSRSPSDSANNETQIEDVDMIATDKGDERSGIDSELSNGSPSTAAQPRTTKFPGAPSSLDSANMKVLYNDNLNLPEESVFPTSPSFLNSVSTNQSFTTPSGPDSGRAINPESAFASDAPGFSDNEVSYCENDSKSTNTVGFPATTSALSLESPSHRSQSQQAGSESSSTSSSYKLQISNTPNVVSYPPCSITDDSSTHGAPQAGVVKRVDYAIHSKQFQNGSTNSFQTTPITSFGFSLPPSTTGTTGSTKMHVCWICQKEFPRPSGLATHMNTHSGLKPYKCPIPTCSKTFAVRSNARRHLRIHGIGTNSPNLLFESSNSTETVSGDNSPYAYNNLHSYESSGPAYDHPLHPSSYYYSSPHKLSTSPLSVYSPNEIVRTLSRGSGIEQNRKEIIFNGRVSTAISGRSSASCPPDGSSRHRHPNPHAINRKGLIQNRCHPYYPKTKAYSHYPSPHLTNDPDDHSYRTLLRLTHCVPSELSMTSHSYSPLYNHPEIESLDMYQLRNAEVKTESNVVVDEVPGHDEENKMELVDSVEWEFYGSRVQGQEPRYNVEVEGDGTVDGIGKLEGLPVERGSGFQPTPAGYDHVGSSTTRNFLSDDGGVRGEDPYSYSTIADSDISSVIRPQASLTPTPSQRPTSTSNTRVVSRGGSISEIDTPTLSTVSAFSMDSSDMNTVTAVASRSWIASMSPNTESTGDHDLMHSVNDDAIYHPIASLPPSSSAMVLSLSAYNLTTEPITTEARADSSPI